MAFWWVNQNQTLRDEIQGGFIWSPKRNKNGSFNRFYENMKLVEPGDVILSFLPQIVPSPMQSPILVGEASIGIRRVGWFRSHGRS